MTPQLGDFVSMLRMQRTPARLTPSLEYILMILTTETCECRCPSPSCSGCVEFRPQAADGSRSNSGMLQALQAGRSFDVVCGCGHAFCFACAADAHEPATCQQVSIPMGESRACGGGGGISAGVGAKGGRGSTSCSRTEEPNRSKKTKQRQVQPLMMVNHQ